MKAEYKEGPEARGNFEKLASALFQAPKKDGRVQTKKRRQSRLPPAKSPGKDKG